MKKCPSCGKPDPDNAKSCTNAGRGKYLSKAKRPPPPGPVRPSRGKSADWANPVAEDGTVILDHDKIEARQDAQARRLLAGSKFSLIVLGGAHDLSDNLDRLSGGQAEYIREMYTP